MVGGVGCACVFACVTSLQNSAPRPGPASSHEPVTRGLMGNSHQSRLRPDSPIMHGTLVASRGGSAGTHFGCVTLG